MPTGTLSVKLKILLCNGAGCTNSTVQYSTIQCSTAQRVTITISIIICIILPWTSVTILALAASTPNVSNIFQMSLHFISFAWMRSEGKAHIASKFTPSVWRAKPSTPTRKIAEREREREKERVRERELVRERECVCEREREIEKKRENVSVWEREDSLCLSETEWIQCVLVSERRRKWERET